MDNNFTRNIAAKNPLTIVCVKGIVAGSFSLLLSLALNKPMPGLQDALLTMLLGFVCYGVSIALFILAMRGLGAARTGILFGTAPFIGMTVSLLIFRDPIPPAFFAAVPIMLAGAWLMMSEDHGHEHLHGSLEHEHAHTHPETHHPHEHDGFTVCEGKHCHPHAHSRLVHAHHHTPDLHHRHEHAAG
jgi:multidrug transporter EmrE-like cation transporter